MKGLFSMLAVIAAALPVWANADEALIHVTSPIRDVFTGDPFEWRISTTIGSQIIGYRSVSPRAQATDLLLVTDAGMVAFDLARGLQAAPNDDRRILREQEELDLTTLHVVGLELNDRVIGVELSPQLARWMQCDVDGRYVMLKYNRDPAVRISEKSTFTVQTEKRDYTFNVAISPGGAPIYRVLNNL